MPPFTGDSFQEPKKSKSGLILTVLAWLIALSLLAVALFLSWRYFTDKQGTPATSSQVAVAQAVLPQKTSESAPVSLPTIAPSMLELGVDRKVQLHTTIPKRPDLKVESYTVEKGDALFEIAAKYKLKPETILWANYDQLNDNPDMISVGMVLNIPPVNGVYYEWRKGDTVQSVAGRFEASIDDILSWPGNQADLTNPVFQPGTWVMVPNGHREFRQWLIPVIPRGRAGVSKSVYGAGACEGGYEGAYGSGAFVWPAGNHSLSGNDYWSGHLGIDIAAGEGAPIYAADSGVVVFAGWATGGYGNMIMIDHGNGYQTLYGHLSSVAVSCGRSVSQGQTIGYAGSTGNSTGAHLHFEVRFQGGFVDPWYVLPSP
jgi:murein DD-endopeptidase MepM/ murein hydrolase activator NlpD